VKIVLHEHRAIQRHCRIGVYPASLSAPFADQAGQLFDARLLTVFDRDTETAYQILLTSANAEADNRRTFDAKIYTKIVLFTHLKYTPNI
jgi:hypothetical protein